MYNVNELKKTLELSLGEDVMKQYIALLKQYFSFRNNMSLIDFNLATSKLMSTAEQMHNHNKFLLAIFTNSTRAKHQRNTTDKGAFEIADYTEYVYSPNTSAIPPDFENRCAATELFLPDTDFIKTRIAIHSWEYDLGEPDDGIAEVLMQACKLYVKNILSAMITRKEGYKVRDRFQYCVGLPVPDPFIRNTNNIVDTTQESKTEVNGTEDSFMPVIKNSLEVAEQQTAFAYSCSKRKRSDGKLTVALLYDTLRENPQVIGLHSVNSINLFKVGLELNSNN